MYQVLIIDQEQKRAAQLQAWLLEQGWQVSCMSMINKENFKALDEHRGLILALDQNEADFNAAYECCGSEAIRIFLTNTPLKAELCKYDHVFYLPQLDPFAVLVKQIQALSEVIEAQALLPVSAAPKSQALFKMVRKVARSFVPILIYGETGVGKEVIAKHLHHYSLCSNGPFVAVNCAALPENMIEDILFGHEKGAFTGATASLAGKFEQAQDGSLLLDEISELPYNLQGKLLRALQEKEIERLGGKKPIGINTRIIAATNRSLADLVEQGSFRKDLFFRLNVISVNCPPLRERKEDIIPLTEFFMKHYAQKMERPRPTLAKTAQEKLLSYPWPGNVRELENVMQRALILNEQGSIEEGDLNLDLGLPANHLLEGTVTGLKETEAKTILETLKQAAGCKTTAAKILNISPRTLRYKIARLKEFGLIIP